MKKLTSVSGMKHACIGPRDVAESSRIQEKCPHSKSNLLPQRNWSHKLTLQKCHIFVLPVAEIRQAAKQGVNFMFYCLKEKKKRNDGHFLHDICHFLRGVLEICPFWSCARSRPCQQSRAAKHLFHYCAIRKTF